MKIKVRVHEASFTNDVMKEPFCFINVRNNYKRRYIKITDVFFFNEDFDPLVMHHKITKWNRINNCQRTLPVTIAPQLEWETWVPSHDLRKTQNSFNCVIVRLNNGKYIISKPRKDVAPSGEVPSNK
jgi:hypothetical protein